MTAGAGRAAQRPTGVEADDEIVGTARRPPDVHTVGEGGEEVVEAVGPAQHGDPMVLLDAELLRQWGPE